jgi:hypothetical protein
MYGGLRRDRIRPDGAGDSGESAGSPARAPGGRRSGRQRRSCTVNRLVGICRYEEEATAPGESDRRGQPLSLLWPLLPYPADDRLYHSCNVGVQLDGGYWSASGTGGRTKAEDRLDADAGRRNGGCQFWSLPGERFPHAPFHPVPRDGVQPPVVDGEAEDDRRIRTALHQAIRAYVPAVNAPAGGRDSPECAVTAQCFGFPHAVPRPRSHALPFVTHGQLLAAPRAAPGKNGAAVLRRHARPESMGVLPLPVVRLKSSLHGNNTPAVSGLVVSEIPAGNRSGRGRPGICASWIHWGTFIIRKSGVKLNHALRSSTSPVHGKILSYTRRHPLANALPMCYHTTRMSLLSGVNNLCVVFWVSPTRPSRPAIPDHYESSSLNNHQHHLLTL